MNILLIGSGGREHALAWRLSQSPLCEALYAAPGNPGITEHAKCVDLDVTDHQAVIEFCADHSIGFVVVGPEAPLVDGLADSLRGKGVIVFGPNADAAILEGSKGFVKDLCAKENIPTAAYARHTSKADALADLPRFGLPVVIKADGLAAGKGVIIAETDTDAREAVEYMFTGGFGDAGAEVVIEEFMSGEEASFFAISDGTNVIPFGSAQDHKRVGDGDTGPNTGGMGAYSPARVLSAELEVEVMQRIIHPTVAAMAREGRPYQGVLFAGLMLTSEGPKLIEYNCRFGDPECQVLMMRFAGDLVALLHAASLENGLANPPAVELKADTALTVVMAANGYPGTPEKGGRITLPDVDDAKIFHAGTAINDGSLVANGGRVLNVTALGHTVTEAQTKAYETVDSIEFPTGFCRRDIGWREVERERS